MTIQYLESFFATQWSVKDEYIEFKPMFSLTKNRKSLFSTFISELREGENLVWQNTGVVLNRKT